jgi:hypothetical protein
VGPPGLQSRGYFFHVGGVKNEGDATLFERYCDRNGSHSIPDPYIQDRCVNFAIEGRDDDCAGVRERSLDAKFYSSIVLNDDNALARQHRSNKSSERCRPKGTSVGQFQQKWGFLKRPKLLKINFAATVDDRELPQRDPVSFGRATRRETVRRLGRPAPQIYDTMVLKPLYHVAGDGLAILHAGFVAGAHGEALESLALPQQGEGEAISKAVLGCFYVVHAVIGAWVSSRQSARARERLGAAIGIWSRQAGNSGGKPSASRSLRSR